jgi:hypothetical protein
MFSVRLQARAETDTPQKSWQPQALHAHRDADWLVRTDAAPNVGRHWGGYRPGSSGPVTSPRPHEALAGGESTHGLNTRARTCS